MTLRPRTISDALDSITPALAEYRKETSETHLQALLVVLVNDLVSFFSVGKTMGQAQLVQTVQLIIEDYYYLNVEDLKLCFNNAKKGVYGKVYDRVDGNIILGWLQQYAAERVAESERRDDRFKEEPSSERVSQRDNGEHAFKLNHLMNMYKK